MAKKSQPEILPPEDEAGTELALFPKLNLPTVTDLTEEMRTSFGTMYTRIEEGIASLPTDMSIKKNRDAVASYAYSIARTKTGLDKAAADTVGDAKLIVDAVNAERRGLKTELDMLRDKARAPLDAWEAEEKAKEERLGEAMNKLLDYRMRANFGPSFRLRQEIVEIEALEFSESVYGEYGKEALENKSMEVIEYVRHWAEQFEKQEAEAAELEQLRREKAEREAAEAARKAEEERKAAEAAEVARQEEERARVAREAEEKAKREAAEAIERAEREKAAAEQRAKEAEEREAKRVEDEKRRAIEEEEARKEAAARAEEQARQREEKAKQDERDRIAREQAAKDQADRERAADIAHRKKLNGEAVAALMKTAGLSEKDAQAVVIAIYKEQVPHVAISY